jgi:hypothetical protein
VQKTDRLLRRLEARGANGSAVPGSLSPHNEHFADAVAPETNRPGYLGPTSYEALLPIEDVSLQERETSVVSDSTNHEITHQYPISKSMRKQIATDILRTLRHYPIILELITWYVTQMFRGTC